MSPDLYEAANLAVEAMSYAQQQPELLGTLLSGVAQLEEIAPYASFVTLVAGGGGGIMAVRRKDNTTIFPLLPQPEPTTSNQRQILAVTNHIRVSSEQVKLAEGLKGSEPSNLYPGGVRDTQRRIDYFHQDKKPYKAAVIPLTIGKLVEKAGALATEVETKYPGIDITLLGDVEKHGLVHGYLPDWGILARENLKYSRLRGKVVRSAPHIVDGTLDGAKRYSLASVRTHATDPSLIETPTNRPEGDQRISVPLTQMLMVQLAGLKLSEPQTAFFDNNSNLSEEQRAQLESLKEGKQISSNLVTPWSYEAKKNTHYLTIVPFNTDKPLDSEKLVSDSNTGGKRRAVRSLLRKTGRDINDFA